MRPFRSSFPESPSISAYPTGSELSFDFRSQQWPAEWLTKTRSGKWKEKEKRASIKTPFYYPELAFARAAKFPFCSFFGKGKKELHPFTSINIIFHLSLFTFPFVCKAFRRFARFSLVQSFSSAHCEMRSLRRLGASTSKTSISAHKRNRRTITKVNIQ